MNPSENQRVEQTDPSQRWFRRLTLLVVVLASAYSMSPNIADPDLWGHVQYGRDLLDEGRVPATTSYSYTAEGFRWINHENLSEVIMAVVVDNVGPIGLVLGKFALSLLVIVFVLRFNLRDGVGWIVASVLALLVAANLGYHWAIRPQLASFVCFTLLVALLQYCFRGWRGRWHFTHPSTWNRKDWTPDSDSLGYDSMRIRMLWLAVPLFFVWANAHGGFVAGLLIFSVYLSCRALEAICQRGRRGWGLVRRMALMIVVAGLATLVNPYGPGLHHWLLESLGTSRPEILDWSTQQLFGLVGAKLWILLFVVVGSRLLSKRPIDLTQTIVLSLTLWQALSHFRHVPFFAILTGFWMGPHLHSAATRFARASSTNSGPPLTWAMNGLMVVAVFVVGTRLSERLTEVRVDKQVFPVDAIAYMHQHQLHGKLVVTYDWAQYAIAALAVDSPVQPTSDVTRVAFDGRFRTCYPQSVVDMHFDFLFGDGPAVRRSRSPDSPPCDPRRVLQFKNPDLILIRRKGELTTHHVRQFSEDWSLLYQDSIAEVWGRKGRYDDPTSPHYLPKSARRRWNPAEPPFPSAPTVAWPALPSL